MEPEMLSAEKLGKHGSVSGNYLGRYFKNQTGDTLQNYIANISCGW
jgi:YesN/AraC family two-component response regulator